MADSNQSLFRYARIDFPRSGDFAEDLDALCQCFPRIEQRMFPVRFRKKESVPFMVERETRLYDLDSITRWGEFAPHYTPDPDCLNFTVETPPAGTLALAPYLARQAEANYGHVTQPAWRTDDAGQIDWKKPPSPPKCYWWVKGWLSPCDIGLDIGFVPGAPVNLQLAFYTHAREIAPKKRKLVESALSACQTRFEKFNAYHFGFEEVADSPKLKLALLDHQENPVRAVVEWTDRSEFEPVLKDLRALLIDLSKMLPQYGERLWMQNIPAVKAVEWSTEFYRAFDWHLVSYAARFRKNFHPDQLKESTPPEGFWQIPLFHIRPGRSAECSAHVYLIQTEAERIYEIQTTDPSSYADLQKLVGQLNLAVTFWDGPNSERWGLHKLLKRDAREV